MTLTRRQTTIGLMSLAGVTLISTRPASAASASQINRDAKAALADLYADQPKAVKLGDRAKAVLIFPSIVKAGLIIGGQTGNGVLYVKGNVNGYFNISAASFGLQAGAESFSYALFFMKNSALVYLDQSDGWSIGTGPNVVVLDKGAAASMTSTTLTEDVYAIPFGQQGLMGGLSLEGSKITTIHPDP
jgi:lipid-binding SYLF domain-containing protein